MVLRGYERHESHLRERQVTPLLVRIGIAVVRVPVTAKNGRRGFLMDKRGEGVPIILGESERLSSFKPRYELIDDSELLLTIYAALPPETGVK